MTIRDIQRELRPFKKVNLRQLRTYIKECRIEHLGVRQRPQQYPNTAPQTILKHLGLNGANGRKAA